MGNGEQLVMQLVIGLVMGGITAAIASSKGRNTVGWFFLGFFFGCISLIIILCLSNLKEEQAKWSANEIEQRRLREQLRQEQLKNDALRQHTIARLDLHDEKLGMDTRSAAPGLNLGNLPKPVLLTGNSPAVPPPGYPAQGWYANEGGQQGGPYTFALLNSRARQGSLSPDTLVWVEGMADWQPAGTIPNLFPA
ncbi:DUF4339 domain-containing protein [Akkermansiaceae bacterium]|nr:DUF4339 domain-containing protein [Akkermansiaceae bacterium]